MREKLKGLFHKEKPKEKAKGKKKKILFSGFIILAAILLFAFLQNRKKSDTALTGADRVNTASVTRTDIVSTLSSSGTILPKNTYSITSMAEGEVIEAGFEEGDQVTEGQVLYRIDASSMESKLKSANNSVERAQSNYQTAVSDYNEAAGKFSGNTYKATKSGFIKTLHIEAGDKVSSNTQIADIYNDQIMKIKIPFLNIEAEQIPVGAEAILTLSDTLEQLTGIVTSVSSMDETMTGGRLIRYVTVQVENPGGLTSSMTAIAEIGAFTSTGDGAFSATVDTVMAADLSENVEVEALLVNEGDFISEGSPIFKMKASTAEKLMKSYKNAMDSAESNLEQAQSSFDATQDSYDNYTVTAPISGTVIKKNTKVGDKVQNGSGAAALAEIYDLSSVAFQMNIDELDITSVKLGQEVEVTADAFSGKKFSGTVTKVSLEGSSSNGVTYYPVTVTLDEVGGLLPGMNVNGKIIVESAKDVMAVPADALMRGNRVYVRDDTVKEARGTVPAGFREVQVETGLISSDYVEIITGDLKEGDMVYLSASSVNSGQSTAGVMMMPGMAPEGGGPGGAPGGGSGGSRQGGSGGNRQGGNRN